MAWIHLVNSYIAGLAEKVKVFSVPVLFEGHDSRANNTLAIDYTIPLPGLPGRVSIDLVAIIKHNTNQMYHTSYVRASVEISEAVIQAAPSAWESTQISIAYQLVDAFSLNLKKTYPNFRFQIMATGDVTQLAPNKQRHYLE